MSGEFHDLMSTIAEQFMQMQNDLTKEKASMTKSWAKREKQIGLIVATTAKFRGGLEALYGSALPELPSFELPGENAVNPALPALPVAV